MEDQTKEAKPVSVVPAQAATPAVRVPIEMSEGGMLIAKTMDDEFRLAKMYIASGMLPARFTNEAMVVTAMQFARELRLPPLTSLRQIAVVHGTPCLFGDLPLGLVQRDGILEWIKEVYLDQDGKVIGLENKNALATPFAAVCIVKRKGDKEPLERIFSLAEAKTAGIDSNPTWKKYPKIMLKYRARSQALKDKCPDSLNGVPIAEYDYHMIPDEESPALGDAASDLNRTFGVLP